MDDQVTRREENGESPTERSGAVHRRSRRDRRRAAKRSRTRVQRWRRRIIGTFAALLVAIPAAGGAGWWYVNYRLGQVHRVKVAGGVLHHSKPGAPFDILLIGSDSRQGTGNDSQFGSASAVGGQRSDVVIIARVVPKTKQIYLLSIPRDTLVDIPGNIANVSGENKINAAFNSGPTLLIKTLKKNFGIPIDHFASVSFSGFQDMVDAVGGIKIDFPNKLSDAYSNLAVNQTGCQLVDGAKALAYVRSRHLYYDSHGTWIYDGMSDWSRIKRQDVFFHALLDAVKLKVRNVGDMNNLLDAVVHNLTVDSGMSNSQLLNLALEFRSITNSSIHTEVLPTIPEVIDGADDLGQAQPYDQKMIASFLAIGTTKTSSPKQSATTTQPAGSSSTTTTTTAPTTTTTTTPPSDVVFDNQSEPWNGKPC